MIVQKVMEVVFNVLEAESVRCMPLCMLQVVEVVLEAVRKVEVVPRVIKVVL